jgi:hypothetical protein
MRYFGPPLGREYDRAKTRTGQIVYGIGWLVVCVVSWVQVIRIIAAILWGHQ